MNTIIWSHVFLGILAVLGGLLVIWFAVWLRVYMIRKFFEEYRKSK